MEAMSAVSTTRLACPSSVGLPNVRPAAGRCPSLGSLSRRAASSLSHHRLTSLRTALPRSEPDNSCSRLVARSQTDSQSSSEEEKVPFGYTRKDVIVIGVGLTVFGFGLRYGLEFFGVDPIQAGSIVQLVVVLGLCIGWVSTYLWRVGNKEMTYAKQLREYENAVMQKRLEAMSETDLEAMLAEVEEEKVRLKAKNANLKE